VWAVTLVPWLGACADSSGGGFAEVGGSPAREIATPEVLDALAPKGLGHDAACAAESYAVCPQLVPEAGTACGTGGFDESCEYGDAASSHCNTQAQCWGDAGWHVVSPAFADDAGFCPTSLPAACPGTFAVASAADAGVACPSSFTCQYPEGICGCILGPNADQGPPWRWSCSVPVRGCPPARPRWGTACTTPMTCRYSGGCNGELMGDDAVCACGIWQLIDCSGQDGLP
jgi:hypothetical protein